MGAQFKIRSLENERQIPACRHHTDRLYEDLHGAKAREPAGERIVKIVSRFAIGLITWVVIALVVEGFLGIAQPNLGGTIVLQTQDDRGNTHEVVLFLRDDDGQWWVESGHWFRGWYDRVVANPKVRVVKDGKTEPFQAIPVDTPEAVALMSKLMQKGNPAGYWFARAQMFFAPIKPVRLDPIDARVEDGAPDPLLQGAADFPLPSK